MGETRESRSDSPAVGGGGACVGLRTLACAVGSRGKGAWGACRNGWAAATGAGWHWPDIFGPDSAALMTEGLTGIHEFKDLILAD